MISSFTRPKTVENNYQWYLNPILFNKNKTLLEFGTYCIIRIRPPQTDFVHRSSLTASIDQGLVWKKHFWFLGSKTLFGIFSLRISHSINCIRIWLITVISPESTSKETRVRCNVSWPIWMVVSLGCPNLLSQTFWLILSAPFDRKRQKIITVVVVEKRTMWSLNVQTIQQNSWFSTKLFRDMTPKVEALMTPRGLNFHFDILWLDKIQPGLHGRTASDPSDSGGSTVEARRWRLHPFSEWKIIPFQETGTLWPGQYFSIFKMPDGRTPRGSPSRETIIIEYVSMYQRFSYLN